MRLRTVWTVLASLQICFSPAFTTPLSSPAQSLALSSDSASLGVPPEFKVRLMLDSESSLDDRDVWINVFAAMYKITEEDLSYVWGEVAFQLQATDIKISVKIPPSTKGGSQLSGKYLVWGLNYIATSLAVTKRFCALTATLSWKGEEVASILIGISSPGVALSAVSMIESNATAIIQLPSSPNPLPPRPEEGLEIEFHYGAHPIDRNVAFQTATKAIAEAAEAGLDTSAAAIGTSGIARCRWYLLAGYGPVLRYRHSREAMRQTMAKMVGDNKFQKILVFLRWRGEYMGEGALDIAS